MARSTPKLDVDRAAAVLVTAALHGDQAAADKHGVSLRTVRRYRTHLDSRLDLAEAVRYKVIELNRATDTGSWANDCTAAIKAALGFIVRAAEQGFTASPDHLEAMSKALAVAVDAQIALRLLDERTGQTVETPAVPDGPLAAGTAWGPGAGPAQATA